MSREVKIPADLDHPDRVLAGLTARQVVILASTAALIYAGWLATRRALPAEVFLLLAVPVAVMGIALAFFRRDGISLDRHAAAALAYGLRPRLLLGPQPPGGEPSPTWLVERADYVDDDLPHPRGRAGRLRLPAHPLTTAGAGQVGVLDLGGHGMAVIAVASPVPFSLSSEDAQDTLVGCFERLLHAVEGHIQILVRAVRLDLSAAIGELAHATARLPHPALRAAAAEHHNHLTSLAAEGLLTRQILLVLREPTATDVAAIRARLVSRLHDAARALAPSGIRLTALDPATADAVLAAAVDPDRPLTLAAADPETTAAFTTPPIAAPLHPAAMAEHGGWAR